jgi:Haem-binding uptake, Tiki superfamily, ChaN
MTSTWRNHYSHALVIAIVGGALVFAGSFTVPSDNGAIAQAQASIVEPNETTKARLQTIINGILAAWNKADVVCLGEDHGSRNDSDLRIALVQHPDFTRKVNVIIVEFADTLHQDLLDRFILEGEDIPRDQLRAAWKDTSGKAVWESPIYEAFLRAVRKTNLTLPRNKRVRLIGGDNSKETNRGRFIREAVSREILNKSLKGLAIYGSGHCECRGMGFPGELSDKYPGKIWAASSFYDVDEGRRVFGLGDEPKLIPITGTEKAKFPIGKMFFLGRYNDPATLGDIFNAIVYYGNVRDMKVSPEKD